MKTFLKKHLGTFVMAPAFTLYILLLPAKQEDHKIKDMRLDHTTDFPIKNSSFVSDLDHTLLEAWVFRLAAEK